MLNRKNGKTYRTVEKGCYRIAKIGLSGDSNNCYIVFEAEEPQEVENELCTRKYFKIAIQTEELENFDPGFVHEVRVVETYSCSNDKKISTCATFSTHDREYKVTERGVEYI